MSQHTKGPWKGTVGKYGQTDISAEGNGGGMWNNFATVITRLHGTKPTAASNNEGKANARLILAAPELLEALKTAQEVINDQVERFHKDCRCQLCESLPLMINAAIAKATGGAR